jgi:hypothetical protein
MCFVRFLAWNNISAFTCLEDWCMGWWKIEMIVHNSDTHILLSWTWPKHERFFKYHYSNWKFTHTKGDTTLLSKKAHWFKQFSLIMKKYLFLCTLNTLWILLLETRSWTSSKQFIVEWKFLKKAIDSWS